MYDEDLLSYLHIISSIWIYQIVVCIFVAFNIWPSQVNSLFLVILLAENLPSLQQKTNEGLKKNELVDSG